MFFGCSANRANLVYNRTFARSHTPKCKTLGLGASAVHVRSRWCSRFFGVGPPQNEKRAILCEKGAYCELASSLSSLDTASEREPAIRRVHGASGNAAYTGGIRRHIGGASSGYNSRDTDFLVRYLRRAAVVVVLILIRCHCRGSIAVIIAVANALALLLPGRRGPRDQGVRVIKRGLVGVRPRLHNGLDVGELVHRVLDRSRAGAPPCRRLGTR